jgi:hypothetical protein
MWDDAAPHNRLLVRMGMFEGLAQDGYKHWIGAGKMQPTADDVDAEIQELKIRTSRVVEFADKAVAHHDRTPPSELPTYGEIEQAVSHCESLIQKYIGLFRATDQEMGIHMQYDWTAIFRVPWIRG